MLQRSSFCRALHGHQPKPLGTVGLDGLSRYQIILKVYPKANQRAWHHLQYSTIRSGTVTPPYQLITIAISQFVGPFEKKLPRTKKKKKEKRSELRAGRRCSRRDSGEKKAHTLPHSISLRTPHKQTLPRAHGSKVVLWLSQGPRGPGTGLGLANTNPTAFTLFSSFKFACAGKGDSDALRSF